MSTKKIFISLFFLAQFVSIFYQLNADTKFFNWSMYHTYIQYTAHATIDGKELDEDQFLKRYKIYKSGIEGRDFGHLKRKLIRREKFYNDSSKVVIKINYTENSHKNVWNWKN